MERFCKPLTTYVPENAMSLLITYAKYPINDHVLHVYKYELSFSAVNTDKGTRTKRLQSQWSNHHCLTPPKYCKSLIGTSRYVPNPGPGSPFTYLKHLQTMNNNIRTTALERTADSSCIKLGGAGHRYFSPPNLCLFST